MEQDLPISGMSDMLFVQAMPIHVHHKLGMYQMHSVICIGISIVTFFFSSPTPIPICLQVLELNNWNLFAAELIIKK